jgi:PAS domain S-box-containing protein
MRQERNDHQLAESLLEGARSRLVNVGYFALLAIGYLVVPVFILRVQTIGWGISSYIHFTVVPLGTIIALFYRKFSLRVRSVLLLFITTISAVGALLTYGIVGSGFFGMALMAVVMASIALGQRVGLAIMLISTGAFLLVMVLVMNGSFELAPNLPDYVVSSTGWIVALVGFVLYSVMLIVGIQAMHTLLGELIDTKIRNAREIEEKNQFLESIFDSAQAMLLVLDQDLKVTRANGACLELTGRTMSALEGTSFIDGFFPEDRRQAVREAFGEQAASGEDTWSTADGKELTIAWNARAVREGATVRYWIVSGMDLTGERQLQRDLQQAEKMRSIGQLAGGVAHDINNMVTAILMSADMLGRVHNQADPAPFLRTITTTCRKAADLTRQLLTFSRIEAGPRQMLDVHGVVDDALRLFEATSPHGLSMQVQCDEHPLFVEGEPTHLVNALLNLLLNARDAVRSEGTITVRTFRRDLDSKQSLGMLTELAPGAYAEITVSDDGQGIAPENLQRIFEPFFTTKPRDRGTGLGLASVYGTIKRHGGAIRVYSELGVGTVFHVYLPCVQTSPAILAPSLTTDLPPIDIVLIEDDESIRHTTQELLTHFGHRVETAADGQQGLCLLEERGGKVDLVVLDWVMPVLGGRETLEAIRRLYPNLPVLVSSGFAPGHDAVRTRGEDRALHFLHKPYRADELLATIARIHCDTPR